MSKKYLHFKILLRPYTTALAKYGRRRYIAKANDSTEQIYINPAVFRDLISLLLPLYFNEKRKKEKKKNTKLSLIFATLLSDEERKKNFRKAPKITSYKVQ